MMNVVQFGASGPDKAVTLSIACMIELRVRRTSRGGTHAIFANVIATLLMLMGLAGTTQAVNDGFTIQGIVTDSGNAVSGAQISIRFQEDFGFGGLTCSFDPVTTTSDASGMYKILIPAVTVTEKGTKRKDCLFKFFVDAEKSGYLKQVQPFTYESIPVNSLFEVNLEMYAQPVKGLNQKPVLIDPENSTSNSNSSNPLTVFLYALVLVPLILLGLLVWFLISMGRKVAINAQRKGRNYRTWFWLSMFFLPFTAIAVAVMRDEPLPQRIPTATTSSPKSREPRKNCPFCGEEILLVAKKCKHCGEFLDK